MKGIKIILLLIIIIFFTYKLHNYINEPFFFRQINLNKNNYDIRFDTKDYDSIIILLDNPFPDQLSKEDSILFYKEYVKATERFEIQDAIMDAGQTIIFYIKKGKVIIKPWNKIYRKNIVLFESKRVVIKNNKTFKVVIDKDRKYQPAIRLIELKK